MELWLGAVELPERRRSGPPAPLLDRLRGDPFLAAMLPRLFEVDGLGARMIFDEVATTWEERERHALPTALARRD
ncbi:hypothetical protein ACSNOB_00670 [Micromonospora sp. URMC 106]|uniref:hypothetical protein n=1 Tax=Micromonospora sp. URMC 106 TaxID=3423408 RepID=UPI003F1C0603